MLDRDLAELYDVETRTLVQAIKRNKQRFPPDFMFQLSKDEFDSLRSQIVTSKGRDGRRYPPYAFTEQGVAMFTPLNEQLVYLGLSSVLKSDRAMNMIIRKG